MTEEATPADVEGPRKPLFVWWSTDESVRDGIPSALACFEVIVAVAAYWTIAIYFETFTHLWVSICIAPLLLLRSDESVTLGAKWFESYWDFYNKPTKLKGIQSVISLSKLIVVIIVLLLLIYTVLHEWPVPDNNLSAIGRLIIIGILIPQVCLALLVATEAAIIGKSENWPDFLFLIFSPSIAIGIWLRSLIVRFAATARYLKNGASQVPKNFFHTLFLVDFLRPAELVPGFKDHAINSSGNRLRRVLDSDRPIELLIHLSIFLTCFIPAYAYRLSIKSTCWLYLPLVYIASNRDFSYTTPQLLDYLGWTPKELIRCILALLTLFAFIFTNFVSDLTAKLPEMLGVKFVSPLEYLFFINFRELRPWQILNLLGALITFYLFSAAGDARVDLKHANDEQSKKTLDQKANLLRIVMRVRNACSGLLILILFIHALLAFSPIMKWLPNYIIRGLSWIYGDYMPPLPR